MEIHETFHVNYIHFCFVQTSGRQPRYTLDPVPVPQKIVEPGTVVPGMKVLRPLSQQAHRMRSTSAAGNSRRSTAGRLLTSQLTSRESHNMQSSIVGGVAGELRKARLSTSTIPIILCRSITPQVPDKEQPTDNLSVSIADYELVEHFDAEPPSEAASVVHEPDQLRDAEGLRLDDGEDMISMAPSTTPNLNLGTDPIAHTYYLQQVDHGAAAGSAGYVSRSAFCIAPKTASGTSDPDANLCAVERILAQSCDRLAPQIESYLAKPVSTPSYKVHHFKDRAIKPLTPQQVLDSDGIAVEDNAAEKKHTKPHPKRALIQMTAPFKRLIQTPYGDFVTKFEYPAFNVTRYSTLSRRRWMSYQISHFDHDLSPEQKMQPELPNVFCFQTEVYQLLKNALTAPLDRQHAFTIDHHTMQAIVAGFERYYDEFVSLPRPVIVPVQYAQVFESKRFEPYGGDKGAAFNPALFQRDEFVYNVDLLGDQFGFNSMRCPAPLRDLLHNEDLAIADAEKVAHDLEEERTANFMSFLRDHKRDRQWMSLLAEHHKIDICNPQLITPADTYTIMDMHCKVALYKGRYTCVDGSTLDSPLPENSVSVAHLIHRGFSVIAAEASSRVADCELRENN